jgi:S-adenosylmethionine decarboxylase
MAPHAVPPDLLDTQVTLLSDNVSVDTAPFEGAEKLLEIWFAASPQAVATATTDSLKNGNAIEADVLRGGLRRVKREVWEEMLAIVQCKVLSTIEGEEMDAYLLSESSLFVSPHKLILKTCGTTLNLLGLPRILEIAKTHCNLDKVWRCFYSRKGFMFPERQLGPHREWKEEIEYLDNFFGGAKGAAYTVGKVNGDHWLLYIISPEDNLADDSSSGSSADEYGSAPPSPVESGPEGDFTIEILMSKLGAPARRPFFYPEVAPNAKNANHVRGTAVSQELGLDSIFPSSQTTIDAYAFEPCGYSANAFVKSKDGEGYYTIHVTPEEGWSYASFECNVALSPSSSTKSTADQNGGGHHLPSAMPDLETVIQRLVQIFQPGHLSLTLFVSSNGNSLESEEPIEKAQRVFRHALVPKGYRRTDKINYEFGGYDLAFASFEKSPKKGLLL